MNRTFTLATTTLALAALTACGGTPTTSAPPDGGTADASPALSVAAAFYPLEYATKRIGGDRVEVSSLTKPGAEPHDVELTPREVAGMTSADLVVYLKGFQPAIDDAVANTAAQAGFDVTDAARLTLAATDDGHDHGHSHGDDDHADDHADEDHADHDHAEDDHAHDHGEEGTDPHFWLDPTRYASVAEAIAERLAEADPAGADTYRSNAARLSDELTALDNEFSSGLATCTYRDLVTGHAAFGYLADRYDLHQVGIAGLSPEQEPTAAQIRDLVAHVRETGVKTVYAETLASPALAETVAREAGVTVEVLDPIEGLSDASAGADYFEIMRANLATLRDGLECSSP